MPTSRRLRSTTAGSAATCTPSRSNTSALPHRLDTDRLPCLATRTPHAATTIAAADEMLKVPARSPPVPHVSKTSSIGRRQRHRVPRAWPWRTRRSPRAARPSSPAPSAGPPARPAPRVPPSRPAWRPPPQSPSGSRGAGPSPPGRATTGRASGAVGRRHRPRSRKFRSSWRPASVSTDSGWNCTPCTGWVLWRTAMMMPSPSVRAATSRSPGRPSSAITSEW